MNYAKRDVTSYYTHIHYRMNECIPQTLGKERKGKFFGCALENFCQLNQEEGAVAIWSVNKGQEVSGGFASPELGRWVFAQ